MTDAFLDIWIVGDQLMKKQVPCCGLMIRI